MSQKFIKKVEDFKCENCRRLVYGDGYTNHCPECLWSKHVDVHPGDRAETCLGLMKPLGAELKEGEWRIVHQCVNCGLIRTNRKGDDDVIAPEKFV